MSSYTHALPRRRTKRWRPPRGWTIFWLGLAVYCLQSVAHIVFDIAKFGLNPLATVFFTIALAIWVPLYKVVMARYRAFRWLEAEGFAVPPVPRVFWAIQVLVWALALWTWS